jgi:hypothetical protein
VTRQPDPDIFAEARCLIDVAAEKDLTVRLIGGLAVREHAPNGEPPIARACKDIDLVTTRKHARPFASLLPDLGYVANSQFNALNAHRRLLFNDPTHERQLDVFVDGFEMCHSLPISERLHVHPRAIPPAELLMTKLQVVQLNEKDEHDIISMLVAHEIRDDDDTNSVRASRVARLCREDWGLWRTTKMNVERIDEDLERATLDPDQRERARIRLRQLWERIESEPKSRRWKMRARLGDKIRWYEEPEEVG